MSSLNGFIMLHRKIMDWEWYTDPVVPRVFMHLLVTASFKKTSWQGQELLPGQVITSYGHIAEKLDLGVRQIRTALDKLKRTGEIHIKSTSHYSVITLVNWAVYQGCEEKPTHERQTTDTPPTNNRQHRNNVNKENKVNKYTPARAKAKADTQRPSIYGTGNYDYADIRQKARARIRERIAALEESA